MVYARPRASCEAVLQAFRCKLARQALVKMHGFVASSGFAFGTRVKVHVLDFERSKRFIMVWRIK